MGNVAKQTLQMVLNGILERGLVENDPKTGVLVLTEKGEEWWKQAQAEAPITRKPRVMDVYGCIENPAWMGYQPHERCGRCAGCINYLKAQAEPQEAELTEQEFDELRSFLNEEK